MRFSFLSLSKTLLVVVIVVILIVFLSFTGALNPVKSFTQSIISPVSAPFYSLGRTVANIFQPPSDRLALEQENERLKEDISNLVLEISSLQQAQAENETLRNLLDFFENERGDLNSVVTRIIGKDPENVSILYLNAGARDGIEVGNAVVVKDGILVAKIIEVTAQSSKALVLTASESQVAVSISGGAPSSKLAKGERGLSIVLDQIPQQETIRQGELVITSGLETTIPNGLLVGEIEEIISEKNDLFQKAVLRPLADAESAQIVSIILTPFQG